MMFRPGVSIVQRLTAEEYWEEGAVCTRWSPIKNNPQEVLQERERIAVSSFVCVTGMC